MRYRPRKGCLSETTLLVGFGMIWHGIWPRMQGGGGRAEITASERQPQRGHRQCQGPDCAGCLRHQVGCHNPDCVHSVFVLCMFYTLGPYSLVILVHLFSCLLYTGPSKHWVLRTLCSLHTLSLVHNVLCPNVSPVHCDCFSYLLYPSLIL